MIRIDTPDALNAWLDDTRGFADGRLVSVERSPGGAVTWRLEQTVRLGLLPGDTTSVEVHELVADAPAVLDGPPYDPGHVQEQVDAEQVGGRMAVVVDVPGGLLRLVADGFTARRVGTGTRSVRPRAGRDLSVVTGPEHDDRYWARRVGEELGAPVVWRVIGARLPRAPGSGTEGCFLQVRDLLATTDHGVFCARSREDAVTFEDYRARQPQLWRAVLAVGGDFARVRSGNCVFGAADWRVWLRTGGFPPDHRLRGAPTGRTSDGSSARSP